MSNQKQEGIKFLYNAFMNGYNLEIKKWEEQQARAILKTQDEMFGIPINYDNVNDNNYINAYGLSKQKGENGEPVYGKNQVAIYPNAVGRDLETNNVYFLVQDGMSGKDKFLELPITDPNKTDEELLADYLKTPSAPFYSEAESEALVMMAENWQEKIDADKQTCKLSPKYKEYLHNYLTEGITKNGNLFDEINYKTMVDNGMSSINAIAIKSFIVKNYGDLVDERMYYMKAFQDPEFEGDVPFFDILEDYQTQQEELAQELDANSLDFENYEEYVNSFKTQISDLSWNAENESYNQDFQEYILSQSDGRMNPKEVFENIDKYFQDLALGKAPHFFDEIMTKEELNEYHLTEKELGKDFDTYQEVVEDVMFTISPEDYKLLQSQGYVLQPKETYNINPEDYLQDQLDVSYNVVRNQDNELEVEEMTLDPDIAISTPLMVMSLSDPKSTRCGVLDDGGDNFIVLNYEDNLEENQYQVLSDFYIDKKKKQNVEENFEYESDALEFSETANLSMDATPDIDFSM